MKKAIRKSALLITSLYILQLLAACFPVLESQAHAETVGAIILDHGDSTTMNPNGTVTKAGTIGTKTDPNALAYKNNDFNYIGTTSGNDSVTFTPNITTAGRYKVSIWWPISGYNATYTVTSQSASTAIAVNQASALAGQWNAIGTFYFPAGFDPANASVKVTGPIYSRIDAVKFEYDDSTSLPAATNVQMNGSGAVGQTLTGSYTFTDPSGGTESASTYQWYSYDPVNAANPPMPIAGATGLTYTPTSADTGKAIAFEVVPKTLNSSGAAARSDGLVIGSGTPEVTVDDNSSVDYDYGFSYVTGNGGSGGYHTDYLIGASAHYRVNLPVAGYYQIYVWTDPSERRRPITKYTINGESTWESSFSGTAGWHLLSINSLPAGPNTINATSDTGEARFDDLKFVFDPNPTPERGRVGIQNGTVVTDRGTLLRGMVGDGASLEDLLYARDHLGINAIHIYKEGGYDSAGNPVDLSKVGSSLEDTRQIVRKAREAGMYVVITTGATKNYPYAINKDFLVAFWSKYAAAFKDDPNVVFEIANEPAFASNYTGYYKAVIDAEAAAFQTIRSNAPNSHIIIFSYAVLLIGASNSNDPSYLNAANPDMLTNLNQFRQQLESNYGFTTDQLDQEFASKVSVGYHAYDFRAWRNDEGTYTTIDDSDTNNPNGTVLFTGSPILVTGNNHATNKTYHTITTTGTASAIYVPNIQTAGTYMIYGSWDANASRPTDVSFQIWSNGAKIGEVHVDQTKDGYKYNYIGTYTLPAGYSSSNVQIIVTGGKNVCLDGLRIEHTTISDPEKLDRRRTEIVKSLESMQANGYAVISTEMPADQSNYNWATAGMKFGVDMGTMMEEANSSWLSFVYLRNTVADPSEFKDPIENTTDRQGHFLRWQPDYGTWPNTVVIDDSDTNNPGGTFSIKGDDYTQTTNDVDANREDITVHGEYLTSTDDHLTASYLPNIPQTGQYRLYGRWNSSPSRPAEVNYQIYNSGGLIDTKTVSQQVYGGSWNYIGTYSFDQGYGKKVAQIKLIGGQDMSIDAIRLDYDFGTPVVPDTIIDDSDTNNPAGSVTFSGSVEAAVYNAPAGELSPYNGNLHINTGTTDATATYIPNIPREGWYDISVLWDDSANRPDGVSYSLYRNGQLAVETVRSQSGNGGQWWDFGRIYLKQGASPDLTKFTIIGGQNASFDAVKFHYVTDDPTLYSYQ